MAGPGPGSGHTPPPTLSGDVESCNEHRGCDPVRLRAVLTGHAVVPHRECGKLRRAFSTNSLIEKGRSAVAWSDWPLIVVALLVGAAAGWVVRGRRKAARGGGTTGDGTPAPATRAAEGAPAPTSTDRDPNTNAPSTTEAAPTSAAATPEPTSAPAPEPASASEPTSASAPEPASASEPTSASAPEPALASEQVDLAPAAPEQAPAADSRQAEEPADADPTAPPVVVPHPAAPDAEPADQAPVAAESGSEPETKDDFRRIQGVGPKMAAALHAAGIRSYRQLAELDEPALREMIRAAGLRGAASLPTWPQQAKALAKAPEPAGALPTESGSGA